MKFELALHHDNAPAHTSLTPTQFVTNKNIAIFPRPPYSPNLTPCHFAFFPNRK
jgi:transposase